MRKSFAFTFILVAIIQYCPGQTLSGSLVHDGKTRDYSYHLPSNYSPNQNYPLVFSLHGATSDGFQQELYSEFSNVADTANFIVCYPDGLGNTWNAGWSFPGSSTEDDVGFIDALIDELYGKASIDLTRVYACGISNGGFMSYRLACELSHRLAAIAGIAGQMPEAVATNCQVGRPFPVMHLHGTLDAIVNYNGTPGGVLSVDSTINWWVNNNGCTGNPIVSQLPNIANEGSTIDSYHYQTCQDQTEVLLYRINNGGHTWPGGFIVPFIGITNKDIEASIEIWNFFKGFSNPAAVGSEEPVFSGWEVFPNPFSQQLQIKWPRDQGTWSLSSVMGLQLASGNLTSGMNEVNLPGLQAGIYLIQLNYQGKITNLKLIRK